MLRRQFLGHCKTPKHSHLRVIHSHTLMFLGLLLPLLLPHWAQESSSFSHSILSLLLLSPSFYIDMSSDKTHRHRYTWETVERDNRGIKTVHLLKRLLLLLILHFVYVIHTCMHACTIAFYIYIIIISPLIFITRSSCGWCFCRASNRFGAFLLFSSSYSSWPVTSTYLLWFGIILHMSCMPTNEHIFLLKMCVCDLYVNNGMGGVWFVVALSHSLRPFVICLRSFEGERTEKNSKLQMNHWDCVFVSEHLWTSTWILSLYRKAISTYRTSFYSPQSQRVCAIQQWTDTFLWSRKRLCVLIFLRPK